MSEVSLELSQAKRGRVKHRLVYLSLGRAWAEELAIGLLLAFMAWGIARDYLHPSLFAWGDHPGQFMRFWYPLAHALPRLDSVAGWNPVWYAGYPELQFYPPGAVLVGLALHLLTLGRLPPEQVYNLVPALAFVLPLFTCYAFLRTTLAPLGVWPSRAAGLAAGLLAVCFTPMWGGIDAVVIGMMGERLAFGLAPLVLLAGWKLAERPSAARLAIAAGLLAGLLLLHPFHAPALVLAVAIYALAQGDAHATRVRRLFWLAGWLALAVGLVAWWLLPLLPRYTPYAAGLVRARPDQVLSWFEPGPTEKIWLAALPALLLFAQPVGRVRAAAGALLALPPLLAAAILLNDWLLVQRLGITTLDPVRFMAEYYLALLLLVGCAVAAVLTPALWRQPPLALAGLVVLAVPLPALIPELARDLKSHAQVAPHSRADAMLQAPALQGLWDALRDDPTTGRVLFTAHYLHLPWPDGTVTPTTITSMTPYLTGREIVGGTFSHWSPVARWLWVGDPWAGALPAQVESEDNRRLFGVPWEEMDGETLAEKLRALHITTVAAGPADDKARALLDAYPHFRRYWDNGYFTLYHLTGASDWIETQGATARLLERSPHRWTITVEESEPGARLTLKMGHYPLWRAAIVSPGEQALPLIANPFGLQTVALPPGGPYTIQVVYRAGRLEWGGLALSLASLSLAAGLVAARVARAIRPAGRSQRAPAVVH